MEAASSCFRTKDSKHHTIDFSFPVAFYCRVSIDLFKSCAFQEPHFIAGSNPTNAPSADGSGGRSGGRRGSHLALPLGPEQKKAVEELKKLGMLVWLPKKVSQEGDNWDWSLLQGEIHRLHNTLSDIERFCVDILKTGHSLLALSRFTNKMIRIVHCSRVFAIIPATICPVSCAGKIKPTNWLPTPFMLVLQNCRYV